MNLERFSSQTFWLSTLACVKRDRPHYQPRFHESENEAAGSYDWTSGMVGGRLCMTPLHKVRYGTPITLHGVDNNIYARRCLFTFMYHFIANINLLAVFWKRLKACEVKNNLSLFEKPFKMRKNDVFLWNICFHFRDIDTILLCKSDQWWRHIVCN